MPLYETVCKLQETLKETIEKQQSQGEIDLVTFTSASTVRGFVQALPGIDTTKNTGLSALENRRQMRQKDMECRYRFQKKHLWRAWS